ncbi:MAG: acyl-CoA dehydrogenase family protein [Deltaproteobacteria bacterium]|nr:acyl-CoA dehydrogenase family protein [Deltaproteobacteria bacterium]
MRKRHLTIIDWILTQRKFIEDSSFPHFSDWKQEVYFRKTKSWSDPADMAIAGGFLADRVSYAFAAGYHSSLHRLVPSLPFDTITAFCVTEEEGGHPRAIKTKMESVKSNEDGLSLFRLNGTKKFITCAGEAELLVVAVSTGVGADGKNHIRMVLLNRGMEGITVIPMKDLHFVPEISHGILRLEDVEVRETDLLPGDGYTEYIKPFRTIEDLHVSAAILGYLFRIASLYDWPREVKEKILCLMITVRTLAVSDPDAPEVHIVFGGVFSQISNLLQDVTPFWENVEIETRKAWDRDRELLNVAGAARKRRLQTAWSFYED